ncbi:15997_t:CDS:2 [Rhizophagus irregularis]|nr:15997_t:CDS:2 [Rhizophagus irregularis]
MAKIILLGFGNGFGFRQLFGISIKVWDFGNVWISATEWFGISATVWDFGNSLEFEI